MSSRSLKRKENLPVNPNKIQKIYINMKNTHMKINETMLNIHIKNAYLHENT